MQESQNPESNQPESATNTNEVDSNEADSSAPVESNAAEVTEELPLSLELQLMASEQKVAELQDAWLRAKADAENIRRRAQTDVAGAHKYAIEKLLNELLPVLDSLEAALAVENATVENFKSGMELTHKQLASVFEKSNVTVINPEGEKFDPHQHQAICTLESEREPNTVIQVMQKGYKLNDRIIRPALVSVSKAKET
jgi:molecular chaperone GrpE